jgi:hypothetical protein
LRIIKELPKRKYWLLSRKPGLTAIGICCADHTTPSTQKSRHCFAGRGGRSVGIIRLRAKSRGMWVFCVFCLEPG